jgi:hypothetical protein
MSAPNPAQNADTVAVEQSAIAQLLVTDDFLKAIGRLNKKHDPKRVLACVKEWVHYMDQIHLLMAYEENRAAHIDGHGGAT